MLMFKLVMMKTLVFSLCCFIHTFICFLDLVSISNGHMKEMLVNCLESKGS